MNVQANGKLAAKSWLVDNGSIAQPNLAAQIMNIMEQGVIVWSADGVCELHNTRIFDVLEIAGADIGIGTDRAVFLEFAEGRGEFAPDVLDSALERFKAHKPFTIDRKLPSGRIVSTSARPSRGGGFVVSYTDVTEARSVAAKLAEAIETAAKSEERTRAVLAQERQRQREAEMLGQLDEWLQSCKSLDELFEIVRTFMQKLLPQTSGELLVYSNSRDVLEGACAWAQPNPLAQISPDSCWALRRGRSYQFEPEALCFVCDHARSQGHDGSQPYICVPIIAHGDTVGLLHILFDASALSADVSDPRSFAIRCGEHISMAIANVKLRDELHAQSIRDPLTGLYNRRFFMDAMRRLIASSINAGVPFGLISFDADKFKLFNDNHGHDAGDVVLQAIAETMLECLPVDAVSCRVGGEEFAVILPQCDLVTAEKHAQNLRMAIEATNVRYMQGTLPRMSISAGVSAFPKHGTAPQTILKQADEALYLAKANGRNCVICAKDQKVEASTR